MAASPADAAAAGDLRCVVVAVDESEESMNALRWALDNLRLRAEGEATEQQQEPGAFHVLHVQPPPSIAAGLNPGAIPFGGPSYVEVPAFTAAIEAHQQRISEAIITHAMQICADKHVNAKSQVVVGDPKELICEITDNLHADLLVMGCRAFGPIKRNSFVLLNLGHGLDKTTGPFLSQDNYFLLIIPIQDLASALKCLFTERGACLAGMSCDSGLHNPGCMMNLSACDQQSSVIVLFYNCTIKESGENGSLQMLRFTTGWAILQITAAIG